MRLSTWAQEPKPRQGMAPLLPWMDENQRKADMRRKDYEAVRQEQAEKAALAQLSPEQRTLEALKKAMEVPANQNAGSGGEFHRELLATLEGAVDWPQPEQDELVEAVRGFFKDNTLKKKQKEANRIIREVLKREL